MSYTRAKRGITHTGQAIYILIMSPQSLFCKITTKSSARLAFWKCREKRQIAKRFDSYQPAQIAQSDLGQ